MIWAFVAKISLAAPLTTPAAAAATLALLPGRELLLSDMLEPEGTEGTAGQVGGRGLRSGSRAALLHTSAGDDTHPLHALPGACCRLLRQEELLRNQLLPGLHPTWLGPCRSRWSSCVFAAAAVGVGGQR